ELFRATDSSTFVSTEGGGANAVTAAGTLVGGRIVLGDTGGKTVRTRGVSLDANDNIFEVNSIAFKALTTLTIVSGDVTAVNQVYRIAGQSGVDDDLVGINGGGTGRSLLIRPSDDAVTITVKHNGSPGAADNILLAGGLDYVMSNEEDTLSLYYDTSLDTNGAWIETSRSVSTGASHAMDGAEHTVGTQGDVVYAGAAGDWALLGAGTSGQVLGTLGVGADPAWVNAAGGGDVTAAAVIGDNLLVRGDGAGKGVQKTGISIDDSDVMSGVALSPDQIILPNGVAPTPTAEGDAQWETDRDLIVVGDGAGQKFFLPVVNATSDPLIDVDAAADGTEDTLARKDHQHPKHHAKYT
ncbi:hypothetical protein LCGC14_3058130, partial [marine sediment metagenome]